jgi:hypothetical protein
MQPSVQRPVTLAYQQVVILTDRQLDQVSAGVKPPACCIGYGIDTASPAGGIAVGDMTLLPDSGPVGKVPTDLEGCDDEADEAAVFAGV